jgi:hypothetical protein
MAREDGQFKKGRSGNKAGRPRGILDKRLRLNKALMVEGDALLKVTVEKAKAGDMGAMSLLMPRMMAALKPEASPVRFEHDTTLSPSKQIESVLTAIAAGQLTVEEGLHVVKAIESLANTRAMEGGGNDNLIDAFKKIAMFVGEKDRMPLPASETESFPGFEDPQTPLPPPVEE